jgi:hypothetical protein
MTISPAADRRIPVSGSGHTRHNANDPAAMWLRGRCISAPERIRTSGLCLRRATLYPAELRAHKRSGGGISRVLFRLRGGIISLGSPSPVSSSSLPGTQTERAAPRPCLALLRVGFTMPLPLPVARCALTTPFHPCLCPRGPSAVCSLLHFPSPHDARALPGTLPCGARTFLERLEAARDPHSPPELSNHHRAILRSATFAPSTCMPRRGLEPPRRFRHQILSLACLPVSAPGRPRTIVGKCSREDSNLHELAPTRS